MLADRQCDAIILYTRHMSEKAIMSLINSIAMPLVVINRDVAQARERCVFFEQQEAAFRAVEYLITQWPPRYRLHHRPDAYPYRPLACRATATR